MIGERKQERFWSTVSAERCQGVAVLLASEAPWWRGLCAGGGGRALPCLGQSVLLWWVVQGRQMTCPLLLAGCWYDRESGGS